MRADTPPGHKTSSRPQRRLGKLRPFIGSKRSGDSPAEGSRRSFLAAKAVAGRPRESVGGSLFFCLRGDSHDQDAWNYRSIA